MKVELTPEDQIAIADMVTKNIGEKLCKWASEESNYLAMVEAGKNRALALYGDVGTNNGVWEVVERKTAELCRYSLDSIIKNEIKKLLKDETLEKYMFEHLLESVIERAQTIKDRVKWGDEN